MVMQHPSVRTFRVYLVIFVLHVLSCSTGAPVMPSASVMTFMHSAGFHFYRLRARGEFKEDVSCSHSLIVLFVC